MGFWKFSNPVCSLSFESGSWKYYTCRNFLRFWSFRIVIRWRVCGSSLYCNVYETFVLKETQPVIKNAILKNHKHVVYRKVLWSSVRDSQGKHVIGTVLLISWLWSYVMVKQKDFNWYGNLERKQSVGLKGKSVKNETDKFGGYQRCNYYD